MGLIHLQLGLQMNDFLLKWFFSWGKKVFWGVFVSTHVVNKRICFYKNRQKAKHNEQTSLSWMFCFPNACQVGLKQQLRWRLRKRHLIITLNASRLIREMLANLVELNTKRLYRSSGKEKESCCLVPLPTRNVKLGTFTSKSWGDGKGMFKKASLWTGSLFGERVKKYFFFDVFVAVAVVVAGTYIGKPKQTIRNWVTVYPRMITTPRITASPRLACVAGEGRNLPINLEVLTRFWPTGSFKDARARGVKRRGCLLLSPSS